jgi:hypothetical protein
VVGGYVYHAKGTRERERERGKEKERNENLLVQFTHLQVIEYIPLGTDIEFNNHS